MCGSTNNSCESTNWSGLTLWGQSTPVFAYRQRVLSAGAAGLLLQVLEELVETCFDSALHDQLRNGGNLSLAIGMCIVGKQRASGVIGEIDDAAGADGTH